MMSTPKRVVLFGAQSEDLRTEFDQFRSLEIVAEGSACDYIVCYGGDGTLLTAELFWPGIPKVPVRNSRRGNRCIGHAPSEVIARLAADELITNEFMKLECALYHGGETEPVCYLTALNEFNFRNARINSAARFVITIDGEAFGGANHEILGDGCIISTPFGSTAYYRQITRGIFHTGIGLAFPHTVDTVNHVVIDDDSEIHIELTRGPALLAFDNSMSYFDLNEGDQLRIRQHSKPAQIVTWAVLRHPSDAF
jgi:NAD+ kinase